jgi:hypothetical protein
MYLAQVTNKETRARFYLELKERLDNTRKDHLQMTDTEPTDAQAAAQQANTHKKPGCTMGDDELQRTDPSAHYYIGTRTSESYDLPSWLGKNAGDPAFKVRQVTLY